LKLRWLKKNIPAVQNFGEDAKPLIFDGEGDSFEGQIHPQAEEDEIQDDAPQPDEANGSGEPLNIVPPKQDEYIWQWKVRIGRFLLDADFLIDIMCSLNWKLLAGHSSYDPLPLSSVKATGRHRHNFDREYGH
jgi:hypothetical protein